MSRHAFEKHCVKKNGKAVEERAESICWPPGTHSICLLVLLTLSATRTQQKATRSHLYLALCIVTIMELRSSFTEPRTWAGGEIGGDAWKRCGDILDLVPQQEASEHANLIQCFPAFSCVGP